MSSNLANNYDVLTLEQQIDALVVEITQQETTIRSLMAENHEVINATTHLCRLIGKLTALLQTKVKPNMAAYSFLSTSRPLSAPDSHTARPGGPSVQI
jgi:regulator of replication initiation timing